MNLCSFCGHPELQHMQDAEGHRHGCVATVCENKKENRGRCAVFTSAERKARNDAWFAAYEQPQTVLPADVANRIHVYNYGGGEHGLYLSCSCAHEAMALLGIDIPH